MKRNILFFVAFVAGTNGFVFPDDVSSRSWSGSGYENENYASGHRPSYDGNFDGNHYGQETFLPSYEKEHGYYTEAQRPNHAAGFLSHSQANAQSSGFGSAANSESGSQAFNDFSQSHAQAESHGYEPVHSYPAGQGGAASASSSASSSSGSLNGYPGAGASAAASAASASGGATSSASSSSSSFSSSGGFVGRPSHFTPWFLRSRISGGDSDGEEPEEALGTAVENETINFSRK